MPHGGGMEIDMTQDVYVDLLFIIDFSMDFLCFYIASRLLHEKITPIRTILGASVGGAYSVLVLFLSTGHFLAFIIDILVCFLMCTLVFLNKEDGIKRLVISTLVYIFVSSVIGGLMTAMFNLLNRINPFGDDIPESDGVSVWIFALLAAVSGIISIAGSSFFRQNISRRKCTVVVRYGKRSVTLRGLNDSGNLLKDTLTGKCVIPISLKKSETLFPPLIIRAIKQKDVLLLDKTDTEEAKRVRLIPCHNTSGETMMIAVIPDDIRIINESGSSYSVDAAVAPTYVGGEEFEALVPDELMV